MEPVVGTSVSLVVDFEPSLGVMKDVVDRLPRRIGVIEGGVEPDQDQLDNDTIGTDVNPRDPIPGKKKSGGALNFIPNIANLGFLQKWFFGDLATVLGAPNAHTSLLSGQPASVMMETGFPINGVTYYYQGLGNRLGRLTIPFDTAGPLRLSGDVHGLDVPDYVLDPYSADEPVDWDEAFDPIHDLMMKEAGGLMIDGADVAYLKKGQIVVDRRLNLDGYRANSEGKRVSLTAGRAMIDVTMTLVLQDVAVLDLLKSGTYATLDLKWTAATAPEESWALTLDKLWVRKKGPRKSTDGEIEIEATGKASKDAVTGTAMKAVLKNALVAADYA